ncbi:hypothetical protein [Citrobacter sp. UYEF32]|uniref:hypothetical protein n=1 Tax=Citrobacter sp. UYEF32 TaxID=3156347 RepID=UPI0033943A06
MSSLQKGVLAGSLLFSFSALAVVADQQWGEWYGNISSMEFELNARNPSGEVITLSCGSGHLAVSYSVPDENYRVSSASGLSEPGLSINHQNYSLNESAFNALKNTGNGGAIRVISMNSAISKDFSTSRLSEALRDVSWQDCINH